VRKNDDSNNVGKTDRSTGRQADRQGGYTSTVAILNRKKDRQTDRQGTPPLFTIFKIPPVLCYALLLASEHTPTPTSLAMEMSGRRLLGSSCVASKCTTSEAPPTSSFTSRAKSCLFGVGGWLLWVCFFCCV
jgi:hypothetical protein